MYFAEKLFKSFALLIQNLTLFFFKNDLWEPTVVIIGRFNFVEKSVKIMQFTCENQGHVIIHRKLRAHGFVAILC